MLTEKWRLLSYSFDWQPYCIFRGNGRWMAIQERSSFSYLSRLRRWTLALACTPLTKSEEKERLLAVYITQRSCGAREKIGTSLQTKNSLLPTGNLPGRTRLNSARRVSLRISTQNRKCRVHYKWLFILWPYVVANWQITCALLLTVVLTGFLWPLVIWRFFCGHATFG